jgi:hypothetical protein
MLKLKNEHLVKESVINKLLILIKKQRVKIKPKVGLQKCNKISKI